LSSDVSPHNRYYEYFGKKYLSSAYLHEYYYLSDKIRLMGNLQLKYLMYDFDQTRMGALYGYQYDLNWLFFSPRTGITYLLNDKFDIFASFALSSREPEDVTIYDAEDPWTTPNLIIKEVNISASNDTTYIFGGPTVKPERLYNFELGGNFRSDKFRAGANLFWMEFRNEIVPEGGIDESGRIHLGNAERSVHSGVELSGSYRLGNLMNISGNSSFNYNRLKRYYLYRDYDYDGRVDDTLNLAGNPVAGFPENISNLIFDYDKQPFRLTYRFRAVGRQYVENGKRKELSIEPYTVSSVSAAFTLKGLDGMGRFILTANVNNIFNEKYELSGYAYENSPGEWVGEYYPAAERNFFVQLRWELE
jgi:iron complex outermembrane receptor protein